MDMPILRRSTDTELIGLVMGLAATVERLEAKVDMLIIQRADEAPDTGLERKLDTLIAALAEDEDEPALTLDGDLMPGERDQTQSL